MENILFLIILSTIAISLLSLTGAIFLFLSKKRFDSLLVFFVAFSAGTLLGGAFLHLLPEVIMEIDLDAKTVVDIFLMLLVGFLAFFVIEQLLGLRHCHGPKNNDECERKRLGPLIILSDIVHNFIDGLVLAASFLVSIPLGFATAIAIGVHEIPQEMGDFGVLVYSGFKKRIALFYNFIASLSVVIGGIVGFYLFGRLESYLVYVLAFTAGHFIYIASSDLVPEIKYKEKDGFKRSIVSFLFFVFGILVMFILQNLKA